MKNQTDQIILEVLQYSRRMLASIISVILFIIGIALIISPLFFASPNYVWLLGIVIVVTAALYTYMRKKAYSMKASNPVYYWISIALECVALILEILPIGAVMVFATSPNERITEVFSYFSLLPLAYANITPMLTGILTIGIVFFGVIAALKFEKAHRFRKVILICSVISFLFSIIPLFLFGAVGMTAGSYGVSGAIFLSICLQAVANRKE